MRNLNLCLKSRFFDTFPLTSRFMFNVGCELAAACQPFGRLKLLESFFFDPEHCIALSYLSDSSMSLQNLIRTSQTTKARMLHYFPPAPGIPSEKDEPVDSWCGFHLDHSLLTGLCSVSVRIRL